MTRDATLDKRANTIAVKPGAAGASLAFIVGNRRRCARAIRAHRKVSGTCNARRRISVSRATQLRGRQQMKTERLPMAAGCGGCSRRELLQGLGVAAIGALAVTAGCSQQGTSLSTATSSSCGSGECIDLTNAANRELTTAGGAMLVDMAGDTIMVVRVSDAQVIALSAICTHAGCAMDYAAGQKVLDCPCHGSQFATDGSVLRGPAVRPLRVYNVTLANNLITVS
jgi:Rieske Fe-S protein